MRYGHFDDAAKEYVIERPDTPRPWSNYLGSRKYGGIITNNAGGYCTTTAGFGRLRGGNGHDSEGGGSRKSSKCFRLRHGAPFFGSLRSLGIQRIFRSFPAYLLSASTVVLDARFRLFA